ncbi:tRNA (adenosine(37)-N6)-dimethylallyltransferase MiaA [Mycoplasmatota bacterium]|nr:tRNA (adenosine(37)-N6)-dimethylallyltransferase MiaA [Mycoplasmatota bacterium]
MKKVLVVIGPTAVGKTALSIKLAKKFNGEIINGDSVQVYKELDIGSAKITPDEMNGIAHHLLSFKELNEDFSVAEFQEVVRQKIDEIINRGKLPIIVGGTGLYIQAVLYDFRFEKEGRSELFKQKYESLSNEELHLLLSKIDQEQADKIHVNNRRRVLRAIEIYENNKQTKSELIDTQSNKSLYNAYIIGLDMDRKILYERINQRVDLMIQANLIDEVKQLYERGYHVNAIGYKEFYDYFKGEKSLDEVIEEIKKNTRHYAKRQLTYFRNKLDTHWFMVDIHQKDQLMDNIEQEVKEWSMK